MFRVVDMVVPQWNLVPLIIFAQSFPRSSFRVWSIPRQGGRFLFRLSACFVRDDVWLSHIFRCIEFGSKYGNFNQGYFIVFFLWYPRFILSSYGAFSAFLAFIRFWFLTPIVIRPSDARSPPFFRYFLQDNILTDGQFLNRILVLTSQILVLCNRLQSGPALVFVLRHVANVASVRV